MKVGDYVRTKNKGVKKIIALYSNAIFDGQSRIEENQIVKSNPNILDLIGCGDVLIIKEYCDEACQIFTGIYLIQSDEKLLNIKEYLEKNKNHKLYSIVTKEQFESMEYKVGE